MRRRQLHLVVHEPRADVQEPAEESGEAEHVVDLVGIVGAPGGHHAHMTLGLFWLDLRHGIRHGKHDAVARHPLDVAEGEDPGDGEPDEDVGILECLRHLALDVLWIGRLADPRLHEVHAHRSPTMNGAMLIHADDLPDTQGHEHLDDGRARRAHPAHGHLEPSRVLPDDLQRVEERRHHHHRGAVLIVVKDRDVQFLAEARLDLEAARGGDVLEVDAPEGGSDQLHGLDDLVGILGVQANGEGVHAGQLLEEHGLALHDGHGGQGSDVTQPEHRRAIGHDGDAVLLDRQRECPLWILLDGQADSRHPRGVGHGEIVARADRHLAPDLDLAAKMHQEGPVGDVRDLDHGKLAELVDDTLAVLAVAGLDGHVPEDPVARHLDQVHGTDVPTGLAYDRGDTPEHAGAVQDAHPDRKAIGSAGGNSHGSRCSQTPVRLDFLRYGPGSVPVNQIPEV